MQAARGTSIGDPDGVPGAGGTPEKNSRSRWRAWWIFAAVALTCFGLDQYTKHLAVEHLTGQPDKQLIGDVLQLRLAYNPGAAFSLGTEFTVAITCLAIVATVVVLVLSLRLRHWAWAVALGFLLAGIDGNLFDRLFRDPQAFHGHVVDFLMLPNWPIFNVADICINIGAVLILILVFRGIGLDGTRIDADRDDADLDDADLDDADLDDADLDDADQVADDRVDAGREDTDGGTGADADGPPTTTADAPGEKEGDES
ncbi:signal peptidase II [Nocardioides sambongensis]|uniref:signal peptidase II n=1 Tax=Nocardioides sambongensis TaxID=2589074 RepID=UPI001E5CD468|nr:signal peptidase II [Nocardioides sambongensis]